MSTSQKALIIENFKPGARFRVGPAVWSNGTPCSPAIEEGLRAQGYHPRIASSGEIFEESLETVTLQRSLQARAAGESSAAAGLP